MNTDTTVSHDNFDVGIDPFQTDMYRPAAIRKLHAIRKQVPNDLLQTLLIAKHFSGIRIKIQLKANALRFGCRTNTYHCRLDHRLQIARDKLEPQLPGDDTRHFEQSSINWHCELALRAIVSIACSRFPGSTSSWSKRSDQPMIAVNGVRNSCDSVERNSSLTRFAASASRRASFSRFSASRRSVASWAMPRTIGFSTPSVRSVL